MKDSLRKLCKDYDDLNKKPLPAVKQESEIEKRIAELEKRVAVLESYHVVYK